jgi:hypothetical protein
MYQNIHHRKVNFYVEIDFLFDMFDKNLDYSVGFGGKFGVQKEEPSRLPASATPPSGKSILLSLLHYSPSF